MMGCVSCTRSRAVSRAGVGTIAVIAVNGQTGNPRAHVGAMLGAPASHDITRLFPPLVAAQSGIHNTLVNGAAAACS